MARGIYDATAGASAMEVALDVTAHNIANAGTAGYRARRVSFSEALRSEVGSSVSPSDPSLDRRPGPVVVTGNPLDVALEGPGWLVVESDAGALLTRAGNLHVRPDGTLCDAAGLPVAGRDGPITVPPDATDVHIDASGTVSAGATPLGTLRVVNPDGAALVPEGDHVRVRGGTELANLENPMIVSGALEQPTYSAVDGMIELIRSSRAYEALTRTIQTISDVEARTARHGASS
jgi:flagellar basal-body rod protein FlgF